MRKMIFAVGFALMLSLSFTQQHYFSVPTVSAAGDSMAQVRLILKKLRSSMASMKDFDELEDAGMDKEDVDRLRNAMTAKIKQMTTDAVDLISGL
jgi:hypothetical protein